MKNINKIKTLLFSIIVYFVLFLFFRDLFIDSLDNSIYYLKEMLLVMPVVIIFTILINAWIPQKLITKHLGTKSNIKGNILSVLLGMFSTGPIYAAFPIAYALKNKGASTQNIVIILSTWAVVKVPMLINEVRFIGFEFMITRWILTIISIILMGRITEFILERKQSNELYENK